ncbi:MAG TPA: carboxypeptidase-like regulatory domain-containing protein, partial [Bacteroidota bacterium]
MKYVIGVLCVLLAVLLALPATTFAQGVTTAAINGRVVDKNGDPLPGVNVVALHTPSGTVYGTTTRADGRYTVPGLRVGGPYTVTATLVGYQKQTRTGINLQLSQTLDLNFTLAEEAVQAAEVVITGERASVFNAARTGATTNVSNTEIQALPTITRNFQDFYKLSPYFTPSTTTGSVGNVLGRNSRYSNIQIDGTNYNDIFGLGSTGAPAGQSNVTPISLDAIEEFNIVVSPYDVRQSNFTGAGINAITRSGTNEYKGSGFYYGRNENFVGKSPDTLKKKLAGFTDYQLGGRAGGPIIENQLFFFVNGEITRYTQPFSRTFGQQNLGTNAYTANADSLNMVVARLKNVYGYDPGSYTDIGYNRESDKAFIRFDYNLSENHKLTARWNYLRSS